jgi:GGDEF domain-containing protein
MSSELKLPPQSQDDFIQATQPPIHEPSAAEQAVYERSFSLGRKMWENAVLSDQNTQLKKDKELLNQAVLEDPLTGLYNRLGFMKVMIEASMENMPFGVIAVDLDKFKKINDKHGHTKGDQVLLLATHKLKKVLRTTNTPTADVLARVDLPQDEIDTSEDDSFSGEAGRPGGDEFLALIRFKQRDVVFKDPGTGKVEAMDYAKVMNTVAGKIKSELNSLSETLPELIEPDFGASVGWTVWLPGDDLQDTIDRADLKMYEDKKVRKNPPRNTELEPPA